MAASKMAAWTLRLLYLSYYPTWEGGGVMFGLQKSKRINEITID